MDEKTKELVEAAAKMIEMPILASWALPDSIYNDFRTHKDTIAALCAVIREQAAQLELLASATKVGAGETLVLVADAGLTGTQRRAAAETLRAVYARPIIVLPHGWLTLPVDKLCRALELTDVSGIEK